MARRVNIVINGQNQLGVNFGKPVGYGGANDTEDVMLIKALFNFIANGLDPETLGLGGDYDMPDLTGVMDGGTYSAISQFQLHNASRLYWNGRVFDWRIDPASYKGRPLRSGKPVMCITLLHIMAWDASLMQGGSGHSYSEGLIKLQPELAQYLDLWDS